MTPKFLKEVLNEASHSTNRSYLFFHLLSFMTIFGTDREYFSYFYCCMSVTITECVRLGETTGDPIVSLCAVRVLLKIVTHTCVQVAFEYLQ